ncbi:T9SS type A sorting domain-containing protein, partial [bacterium]|nr:T9SS type A sorting domain-containing protein [bacterium]
ALYRRDGTFWTRLPGQLDSAWAGGWSPAAGAFLPLAAADSAGPVITARVNQGATGWGQRIRVARPECSVLIEDPDGVNVDSVTVTLDGQAVPRGQFSLPSGLSDTRAVPLIFTPTLADGEHLLGFSARDNLGNRSTVSLAASVSVSFDLLEHANYPNPVDGEFTTFYFFVGDHADRYRLRIYTVAGRHVRTIEGGHAAGVETFPWDLRDHDGRTVANGVYFYTLAVSQGDRTVTRTGKLAVLR